MGFLKRLSTSQRIIVWEVVILAVGIAIGVVVYFKIMVEGGNSTVKNIQRDKNIMAKVVEKILKKRLDDIDALNQKASIHYSRGELDEAEDCYLRVIELGRKSGDEMAQAVGLDNLGLLYYKRDDLAKAKQMQKATLEIEKKSGRLEEVAKQYGKLGWICRKTGELVEAERMYKKAIEVEEKLGRMAEMANNYASLGLIYREWGQLDKARQYGEKAMGFFKKIDMPAEVEQVQTWLDELEKTE